MWIFGNFWNDLASCQEIPWDLIEVSCRLWLNLAGFWHCVFLRENTCKVPQVTKKQTAVLPVKRRARLVLIWVTMYRFNSWCWTFISVCDQPPEANSAFHPSVVGNWVPALAGKAKAGMDHSVSGWTRGVQVKLWNPSRTRAIPERRRGVFMRRRYTNPRLPYLTLPESAAYLVKLSTCTWRVKLAV